VDGGRIDPLAIGVASISMFNSISNLEEEEDLDIITLIEVLNTTIDRYIKGREEK
jgi:hypothetical protein